MPSTASSCGQGCEPAASQTPAWSDGDGSRALRGPSLGHTLGNAGCADFGDCESLAEIAEELVRKVLAQHPDEKTISLRGDFRVAAVRSCGTCSLNSRLGSKMRSAGRALKEAWRVGWPTELST